MVRRAKRLDLTISEEDFPDLWILMPTAAEAFLSGFSVVPTDVPGVYRFPFHQHSGLVVIHQLLKNEETLWLRLLARAGDQKRAIDEFTAARSSNDLYASIKELLADYLTNLRGQKDLTIDEEELIMTLSAVYLKQRETWKEEGLEEGRQAIAINLLREGLSEEMIARATGLTIEVLQALRQGLG
jgi:hypothetical protein